MNLEYVSRVKDKSTCQADAATQCSTRHFPAPSLRQIILVLVQGPIEHHLEFDAQLIPFDSPEDKCVTAGPFQSVSSVLD